MEVAERALRRMTNRSTPGYVVGTWSASAAVAGSVLGLCAATGSAWPAAAPVAEEGEGAADTGTAQVQPAPSEILLSR